MEFLYKFFLFYIPLLFSLCVHEFSHAWMAKKKGDSYAESQGRLTLNPFVHADILGTVILPLASIFAGWPVFGWAKPVPVRESSLKHPKEDMFWIALAGPLSNFAMAFTAGFLIIFLYLFSFFSFSNELLQMSEIFIYINLLLGLFNMIPLHPLDGGKVFARFFPPHWNIFLEKNQHYLSILLISLFVLGAFRYIAFPAALMTSLLTRWPNLIL